MTEKTSNITADAVALQERDDFREQGWLKLVSPAKVNLHLGIGARRSDGYHDAVSVMHALNLHDVVYLRRRMADSGHAEEPLVRMVSCADVTAPSLAPEDNIAYQAIVRLAAKLGRADTGLEVRIEKNIPAQAGLGGGSSNAAATLVGAAALWGVSADDPAIEETAQQLGSDVAFFLRGGCASYEGTGDVFVRALEPSKQAVVLVKPTEGVSTAEAYRAFDRAPVPIPDRAAENARSAQRAADVELFNNLAPASEALMPQLAQLRTWLLAQQGVRDALLCGSGAATFAICEAFADACRVAGEARKQGLWARATSFGSIRAMLVSS